MTPAEGTQTGHQDFTKAAGIRHPVSQVLAHGDNPSGSVNHEEI